MKNKSGQTVIEYLVIGGIILLIIGLCLFPIFNKYVFGNKSIVDFKQNFNVAYVLGDSNMFDRVKIKAWKDYENSDSIQIIDINGKPIYTHLRNVKLTKE